MRAIVCTQICEPADLTLATVPPPVPAAGEVVIEVAAAGVNFPDLLMIRGKYQNRPPVPFSPGLEVAGVVGALGNGVTGLAPGARVLAICDRGGFAEQVAVSAAHVFALPDTMDMVTAAGFPVTYATSLHALQDRAALRRGETLLVLGAAGGVGLAAVEIGKAMGARVIAAASSADKLALCRTRGADALIDYGRDDLRAQVRAVAGDAGVDVVYDPVGGALAEPALRSLAWGGRYLVVGFAAGEIPRVPLNLPLLKSAAIVGVLWGAFARREPAANAANLATLFLWLGEGKLRPHISATYPLEAAGEALAALDARRATGKLVLVTGA